MASNSRSLDLSGLALTVLCCAFWGGNAVAVKFTVPDLPAIGCAGIRFLIALPLLFAYCRWAGHALTLPRPLWRLMALHVAITVIQIGSFNWGTSLSLAGRSSAFINIHPLIVAPLAWTLLGERASWRGVSGLVAATLGVAVLLWEPLSRGGDLTGDLVVLASGMIFGAQTVFQKATFHLISAPAMLFWQTLLGAPTFFALSLVFEGPESYHFTTQAMWGVLYQGVAVSCFCFMTWMVLLHRYRASQLAPLAFLTPMFGITFGALMRGETLTWPLLAGGSLIGVGIYLAAFTPSTATSTLASQGEPSL